MKNPLKQMKRVQTAMIMQAYQAYCYGHQKAKEGKPLMALIDFSLRIKEVVK